MADAPEIEDEINDATQDLRDALHQVGDRVEEGVARLRPDHGIRKHPVTTACIAGALGFALGSESGEIAMIGLLLLGAVVIVAHENRVGESDEVERV
jgi:hypothetical protein